MHSSSVPIQTILFTVFQSIFEVFLLCLAGFVLSFKGIVTKPISKAFNHVNIALFTPALLFSKVAYFLSPAKLRQLWVIPIFFVVLTGLSALVAHWLARAFRLKRSQVNFATAAAMFMNSNSLPVALMQSLAATVPLIKWGPDDTIDAMFGRSLTYLVVFSTLGMILRWSYGIHLLSQADEPHDSPSSPSTYRDSDCIDELPELVHIAVDPAPTAQLVDYETQMNDRPVSRTRYLRSRPPHAHLTPPARRHHLHSHLPTVPTSLGDQSESDDSDELYTTEGESEATIALPAELVDTGSSTEVEDTAPAPAPHMCSYPSDSPRWDRRNRPCLMRLFTSLTSLSPPLVASILALLCVLIPPIQRMLNSDEMIPFKGALDNAGGCSIPLTMIILGGWFWDGETNPKSPSERTGSDRLGKGKCAEHRHRFKNHMTSYSRDSSAGSLIGTFGGVFMTHLYPRGARRAKLRGTVLANQDDVEPGPLATHTESQHENGYGRASRSRSRACANAAARLPPIPMSPTPRGMSSPGETLTIIVTLLTRMIIVPLLATPMLVLVSRLGWGGEVFEDPVFIVSSMLLIASPPALTLAQISQRTKASTTTDADADSFSPFERLLSRTIFWAYCVLTPPVMIASVMVGLLLIDV